MSGASNVLGTCSEIAAIGRIVHRHGARLFVDAAQLVAHRQVDIERWGIDFLAFSAHQVYAPFGGGVLVVRKGLLRFDPAELEATQSSGEENAGGIAVLGKALVLLQRIGMELIDVGPSLERFQRVIQALFPRLRFPGMVRVSLGIENDSHDVDELMGALGAIAKKHPGTQTPLLSRREVRQQMTELAAASARRVYSDPRLS